MTGDITVISFTVINILLLVLCLVMETLDPEDNSKTFEWALYWNRKLLKYFANVSINNMVIPCIADTGSPHLILREQDISGHVSSQPATCAQEPLFLQYTGGSFETVFIETLIQQICMVPTGISMSNDLPRGSLWGLIPTRANSRCPSSIECLLEQTALDKQTHFPAMTFDLRFPGQETMWLGMMPLTSPTGREMVVDMASPETFSNHFGASKQSKLYVRLSQPIQGMTWLLIDTGTTFTKIPKVPPIDFTFSVANVVSGPQLIGSKAINRQPDAHVGHNGKVGTLGIFDMMGLRWTFICKRNGWSGKWEPFQLHVLK